MKSFKSAIQPAAFQLKGSLFTLTVLHLLQTDIEAITNQLDALVKSTPNFFRHAPVVIDLDKLLDRYDSIDFGRIKAELTNRGLIPVGLRNGDEHHIAAAIAAGLSILPPANKNETSKTRASSKNNNAKIITQPVRSGQQVYAHEGDLIILASVSAGAELMADGNIHVYGPLRGRALAGVTGDTSARIFCLKLEAELVSIAGYYKLRDDIKIPEGDQGMHIYLEEEKLQIDAI